MVTKIMNSQVLLYPVIIQLIIQIIGMGNHILESDLLHTVMMVNVEEVGIHQII